jgi:precorrin-2/cobalt-factor-2 C20-methyltransferase
MPVSFVYNLLENAADGPLVLAINHQILATARVEATLPEDELEARARDADALVVMKIGRNLPKLRRALAKAGRLGAAWLIERGTMPGQSVQRLSEAEEVAPYFAIVVVHGQGRRP